MRDPVATKLAILNTAGELFNIQGYKATSISDITSKLGMTKGAIYRHFGNKSTLEKEALIHLTKTVLTVLESKIKAEKGVKAKLEAILLYFADYVNNSPIPGGCPLLNASIEADDTSPTLKVELQKIIDIIHRSISRVLYNGIRHGQLRQDVNIKAFSTLMFSALEGAIMMTKITHKSNHMEDVVYSLRCQINDMLI